MLLYYDCLDSCGFEGDLGRAGFWHNNHSLILGYPAVEDNLCLWGWFAKCWDGCLFKCAAKPVSVRMGHEYESQSITAKNNTRSDGR